MVVTKQGSDDTPTDDGAGGLSDQVGLGAELVSPAEPAPPEDALTTYGPWAVSIVMHIGLVLLALFVVWSTVIANQQEQIIIPTARLSATPGAPLQIKQMPRLKADPIARRTVSPLRDKSPVQLLSQPKSDASLVGVLGASGDANPFEATISGGGELRAQFLGSGGNARRIAFVIDASGSLIDTFPFVIRELKRSISQLSPRQQFTVIFYQGDDVIEVLPHGIDTKRATSAIKQQVAEQLAQDKHFVSPQGSSNPVRALRKAFGYRPQLVFLLSDAITGQGQYEIDQRRLLEEIERVNRSGTKINTIQFLYPDPLLKAGLRGTMELIAEQSGGTYTYFSKPDLNID
jgi:VWA domain-containing protein